MLRSRRVKKVTFPALGVLAIVACVGTVRLNQPNEDLTRAYAEARAAGVPLTPADFPLPTVPASQNAAPEYDALNTLFLGPHGSYVPDPQSPTTPTQVAEMRHLLTSRPDITARIHKAVVKPHLSLPVGYAPQDPIPDLVTMDEAVNWLVWEGRLRKTKGGPAEAVRIQASGLQVAKHLAELPSKDSGYASLGIAKTVFNELDQALRTYAPDQEAVTTIQQALNGYEAPTVKRILDSDHLASLTFLGVPYNSRQYLSGVITSHGFTVKGGWRVLCIWTMPGPVFRHSVVEPATAEYLRMITPLIVESRQAEPRRSRECERLITSYGHTWPLDCKPLHYILARGGVPYLETITTAVNQTQAQRNVLLAAAGVMAYRNRTGHWPSRLSEAMSDVPCDPFDSSQSVRYRRIRNGYTIEAGAPRYTADRIGRVSAKGGAGFSYPDRYTILPASQRAFAARLRASAGPLLKPM